MYIVLTLELSDSVGFIIPNTTHIYMYLYTNDI